MSSAFLCQLSISFVVKNCIHGAVILAPNQALLLHDYFTRNRDLWSLCEQYDCDHDQMLQIIGAIAPYLPGKGLDYSAILSKNPIVCDHLVLHCHRAIGQLDGLYDRLISHFDSVHDGTEKIETTALQDKQRFRVLESGRALDNMFVERLGRTVKYEDR